MSLANIICREIFFRKTNFLLSLFAVAAAAGVLIFSVLMLKAHDLKTEKIISEKEAVLKGKMDELEDASRVITKRMGFNVLVIPRDQNLGDLYSDDFASKFMPESYAQKLADSKIITIRHLLPSLIQKIKWTEKDRTVILIGTRGEVPSIHLDPQKPIMDAVKPDTAILGYELHRSLGLKQGDRITLLKKDFTVDKCFEERGNKDDITVWINLAEAQELLGKKGLVNGIMALECNCAMGDIAKVRQEIAGVLPDTQVIEFKTTALARAEIRRKAADTAKASLDSEKASRTKLRMERENSATALVSVFLFCAIVMTAFLALINVKERKMEIGIFRALGFYTGQIYRIILFRAFIIGLAGSAIGCILGAAAFLAIAGKTGDIQSAVSIMRNIVFLGYSMMIIVSSTMLIVLATIFPAHYAAQQDPAEILREE